MGIGDPGGEELIGGKQRFGAGTLEDSRDRSVRNPRPGKRAEEQFEQGKRSMAI